MSQALSDILHMLSYPIPLQHLHDTVIVFKLRKLSLRDNTELDQDHTASM